MFKDNIQCSEGIGPWKKSGGDGAVVTPVTIPNTEVKHRSGEDSEARKACENSAPPGFFLLCPPPLRCRNGEVAIKNNWLSNFCWNSNGCLKAFLFIKVDHSFQGDPKRSFCRESALFPLYIRIKRNVFRLNELDDDTV